MKKIVVLVPSYNNSRWYERNLSSIVSQDYDNFSVVYTDDCSPDNTGELVREYIEKHDQQERVKLIENTERKGALCNLYNMIHECADDDIVVTLDGDDWLAHSGVLKRVNQEYQDNNVWFTWGSYMDHPQNSRGCCKPIPKTILDTKTYRRKPWCTSHLRTFKAKLFKLINRQDFNGPDGKWLDVAWDLSFYMPFVEMAGHHGRYIHDILYIYNNENPIQDYKIKIDQQTAMDRFIRSKRPYKKIEAL
jgi:glycosyltransferase involved in cell wall biosynthesis